MTTTKSWRFVAEAAAAVALVSSALALISARGAGERTGGGAAGGGGDGTFEWTSAVSDDYFDQSRWTLVSGAGAPPPQTGDVAVFNEPGSYTVTFASGGVTHTDLLRVEAGNVRFRCSSSAIGATYSLTTNEADATIQNCVAIFGLSSFPVSVVVGDDTIVWNNGWLEVDFGSSWTTDSLALANQLGNSGDGRMIVGIDSASTVNVIGQATIGIHGDGELEIQNDSQVTFGGTSFIGTGSSSMNAAGNIDVLSGSDLVANSAMTIGGGHETDSGVVLVRNPGSTLTLTGASNLTIGGALGSGSGTVLVDGEGLFTTGSGLTRVRATGAVRVNQILADGQFVLNGTLEIDGGDFTVWGADALTLPVGTTVDVFNGGEFEIVEPYVLNFNRTISVATGGRYSMGGGGAIGDGTNGAVIVDGDMSSFEASGILELARNGADGTLAFSNGAFGDFSPAITMGQTPDSGSSSITIEGGSEVSSNVTNVLALAPDTTATITIDGLGSSFTVSAAHLGVGHPLAQGDSLVELFDNGHLITIEGAAGAGEAFIRPRGLVHLHTTTTWDAGSEIFLEGGELRVDGILNMQGDAYLRLTTGVLSGAGLVRTTNTTNELVEARSIIQPGTPEDIVAILKFEDSIVEMHDTSVLEVQLAGTVPDVSHDQLWLIDGIVLLNGTLEVSLLGNYAPEPGDEFVIVLADGLSGDFDAVIAPTPMEVIYTPTEVRLKVLASCLGDFVQSATFAPPPDGVVDAADLAFLLGHWNVVSGSPADMVSSDTFQPPPDGIVDAADLAFLLGAWGVCE